METTTPVICGECQSPMALKNSRFGKFWGCTRYPLCMGTHGAHPDGKPLGVPANAATKQARMRAHAAFDRLWRSGKMSRTDAYRWMQKNMDLTKDEAHIGKFDMAKCAKLEDLVSLEMSR